VVQTLRTIVTLDTAIPLYRCKTKAAGKEERKKEKAQTHTFDITGPSYTRRDLSGYPYFHNASHSYVFRSSTVPRVTPWPQYTCGKGALEPTQQGAGWASQPVCPFEGEITLLHLTECELRTFHTRITKRQATRRAYFIKIKFLKCYLVGRDSSVGIATRYGLDGPEIEFRWGRDFPHRFRPALRSTLPPVQWVPGVSLG
jgi:hypothetical protein